MTSDALSSAQCVCVCVQNSQMASSTDEQRPAKKFKVESQRQLIIDTDAGCDDAVAILLAMHTPGVNIKAFLSVHGNVDQVQATGTTSVFLSTCGHICPARV